jgi:hypothetical protein
MRSTTKFFSARESVDAACSKYRGTIGRATIPSEKCRGCQRHHEAVPERAPSDAQHRFDDDREHCRLEPEEQRRDRSQRGVANIEPAQHQHHQHARQHEQATGDDAAPRSMQEPADIRR